MWETGNEVVRRSLYLLRHPVSLAARRLDPTRLIIDESGGDNYSYPQDVSLEWRAVAGATFYQVEVYSDSLLTHLYLSEGRVTTTRVVCTFGSYGTYFWHARAASRSWNDYTDWSAPFRFTLPNPAR
jgi:hypothetical protein